jgi:hypothetical protein
VSTQKLDADISRTGRAFQWDEQGDDTAILRIEGGRPIARYSYRRTKNHPFFFDVKSANYGATLTNHAPHDHRWHHGLWWSWKFINDVLYWEDHPDYGGNRIGLGRSEVTDHSVVTDESGRVHLTESLHWRSTANERPILTEERTLTLMPSVAGLHSAWAIDWDMRWTAVDEAVFETTPYPDVSWGGYAGLNYRPARSMSADESIIADGGRSGAHEIHGEPVTWMAYTGRLDGSEVDEPDSPATGGVAILEHPENPRHPGFAYTQGARDGFGFLAAAPLMRNGMTMEKGTTLRLRYRTLILGEAAESGALDAAYDVYRARNTQVVQ